MEDFNFHLCTKLTTIGSYFSYIIFLKSITKNYLFCVFNSKPYFQHNNNCKLIPKDIYSDHLSCLHNLAVAVSLAVDAYVLCFCPLDYYIYPPVCST